MLNAVIRFSLRYRLPIVFICLAVLLYGSWTATTLPIDVFPSLDQPRVVIMTECHGYAPADVETQVTFPLESAINGASNVESIRSDSGPGMSVIQVNFHWGTNIYTARQIVQERINGAQLPPGVSAQLSPISSVMGLVMFIGMSTRPGPEGGILASVPKSDLALELKSDVGKGVVSVKVWQTRNAEGRKLRDPAAWKPAKQEIFRVELTWTGQPKPVVLQAVPGMPGKFQARAPPLPLNPAEVEWQAGLTVEHHQRTVHIPTFARSQLELRTLADWVVKLRLLKVPGIAQVANMGGGRKQYQVLVDPYKLGKMQVSLEEVSEALRKNNVNVSAGWAAEGEREKPIRFVGRLGPASEQVLAALEQIPVKQTPGVPIRLKEVARVVEGHQEKRGDTSIDGLPGVLLTLTKQPNIDTRELTQDVLQALEELEPSLPDDVAINADLFRMQRFIDLGVYNVGEALAIGAVLVLIVLFLFLLNLRTTFISLTAIPLSLATTAIVFRVIGWLTGTELSINVMTLGGIAVAMGELVDDAIVDVENIFRRLRENSASPTPRSALRVIYEASVEVRSAIVFGTMMVILVFVPLFALSGIEGRLFAPLGIAYIVSILASLAVSLTLTPVLAYYLLPQSRAAHRATDSPLLRVLKWGTSYLIRFSMRYAAWLLLATWAMVGFAAFMLTQLGSEFLPKFDEGSFQVNVTLPAGSSLAESNRVAESVDRHFRSLQQTPEHPERPIAHFLRRTGRGELEEHFEPVYGTEYILSIHPASEVGREELKEQLLRDLRALKLGADIEVEQPLSHLIDEVLSGVSAQVAIKVYGDDLTQLRQIAGKIKVAISSIEGIAPPVIEQQSLEEEIQILPRQAAIDTYGIDRDYLGHYVRTALFGEVVSQVIENERRFDLVVKLDDRQRSNTSALEQLPVARPGKRADPVPLGVLADVVDDLGPNQVRRDNVRRRIAVRVNSLGRDIGSVVADIKERVAKIPLPEGYFVEYGGQFESQQRASRLILILGAVCLIGMFVVLFVLFPSWRIVLQILNALPAAFIGGVAALVLTNQDLTIAGMVGFISLGGIAARNGILLVTHYFHLMKHEGEGFTQKMILRGSLERLAPVLMTALTAGIALIPLVLGGHQAGREILYPVATVILGGLVTSTLCEFLLHPGLFWQFSGHDAERLTQKMDEADV